MADMQNGMSFYTLPVSELTNYSEKNDVHQGKLDDALWL